MYKFIRLLVRIINAVYTNKLEEKNNEEEESYFNNKYDEIINKYKNKFNNIKLKDENNNNEIFKHWKGVVDITVPNKKIDIENISTSINLNQIIKIDENGNILLYYLINNLNKLINYNDNKILKSNLCTFILDFINIIFDTYNEEEYNINKEYRQFYYS